MHEYYFTKETAFILGIPIWILGVICSYIIRKNKGVQLNFKREVFFNILYLYVIFLVGLVIFPLKIGNLKAMNMNPEANLIPVFNTVEDMQYINSFSMIKFWFKNIMGNTILMMPLGIFLPLLWDKFRSLKSTVIFCFSVSLSIEIFQFISGYWGNYRIFDIDDLILNTLGAFIGYLIYDRVLRHKTKVING